jgi:MFS family permease
LASADRPHSVLRRLAGMDKPYKAFEGEALKQEIERNYRWNLVFNTAELALFWFGLSFIAATTILPLFVSKLTASTLAIGLVALLAQGGWSLPQVFTANPIERAPRMLPIMVNIGFFIERLPLLVMVLAALLALSAPSLSLVLVLLGFAWHTLGSGSIAPSWQELVGRCFPANRRGRFLGVGSFVGIGFGALGAAVSSYLLAHVPYPRSFVTIFALGAFGIMASLVFLAKVREPVPSLRPPRRTMSAFWSDLRRIVRTQANFRFYLTGRALGALGGMSSGFLTLSALRIWQVSDGTVGAYTGVMLIGQALGTLFSGLMADRRGHKLSLEVSFGAFVASYLFAAWSPFSEIYFLVFLCLGFGLGGVVVSGILLSLEFAEPGRQPTYAGVTNTLLGILGMIAPLIGAWLAARNFTALFVLGATLQLGGLIVFRLYVKDPRFLPAVEAPAPTG